MTDYYSGVKGIYFWRVLKKISKMTDFKNKKVLDFGCGLQKLKYYAPNYIGYDADPELSQILDWKTVEFDIMVVNQVFYEMAEDDVYSVINELYSINPDVELIVGISRKSWINKIGAWLLKRDAHSKYNILPSKELEILLQSMTVVKSTSVLGLCDLYMLKFLTK